MPSGLPAERGILRNLQSIGKAPADLEDRPPLRGDVGGYQNRSPAPQSLPRLDPDEPLQEFTRDAHHRAGPVARHPGESRHRAPGPADRHERGEDGPLAGRSELAQPDRRNGDAEPPFELAGEDLAAAVGPVPFRGEGAPASDHEPSGLRELATPPAGDGPEPEVAHRRRDAAVGSEGRPDVGAAPDRRGS